MTIPAATRDRLYTVIEQAWDSPITEADVPASLRGMADTFNRADTRAQMAVAKVLNRFTARDLEPLFTTYEVAPGRKGDRLSDLSYAIVEELLA